MASRLCRQESNPARTVVYLLFNFALDELPAFWHKLAMQLPRTPLLLLISTGLLANAALASESLSASAASLKNALNDFHALVSAREPVFKMSSGSALRQIDHARDSAGALQQKAGNGGSREEVGPSMNDLRTGIETMRRSVTQLRLSEAERTGLRNVDFKYGDVVRNWEVYGTPGAHPTGAGPSEVRHPDTRSAEAQPAEDRSPDVSPIAARPVTTTSAAKPAAPPAKSSSTAVAFGATGHARTVAVHYLTQTYHLSDRVIQIQDVLNLGQKSRVTAYVGGHLRAIDVANGSGEILLDMLVN